MLQHYKNLLIIGTSHISEESIKLIEEQFNEFKPEIVCVELDNKRLYGLLHNTKPDYSLRGIKKYGFQGYLFAVIASFIQKKLGNVVNVKPGSDMLTAVKLSKKNHSRLELIDQDIDITLKNFSKNFTFKEKCRLVCDIFRSPFSKKLRFDISKVPSEKIIIELMALLKKRYPSIHKVIIDDRNIVMSKNIYSLMSKNPENKILVVVGAGHQKDLLTLIKKEEFKRDKVF